MAALTKDVTAKRWTGDPPLPVDDALTAGQTCTIVAQNARGVTIIYTKDAEDRRALVTDRTAFTEADLNPNPPFPA